MQQFLSLPIIHAIFEFSVLDILCCLSTLEIGYLSRRESLSRICRIFAWHLSHDSKSQIRE